MSDLLLVAGASLGAVLVVMGATVAWSRVVGRVAVVDVAWGLMFVAVALVCAVVAGDAHSWLLLALVALWGGRLAWHVQRRSGGEEDPRYAQLMGERGFSYALTRVFALQAGVAYVISLPLQAAAAVPLADAPWGWTLVAVGLAVYGVGLFFEVVGDRQLAAYMARPRDARPPVMDQGLWAWTRHPNYFGDAAVWWGLWLAAALASGWLPGLLTVLAPAAMTHFIRNVTGARLLERTMAQREGWEAYAARTPYFVPRPPRR